MVFVVSKIVTDKTPSLLTRLHHLVFVVSKIVTDKT